MTALVTIDGVTKRFGPVTAIDAVSAAIVPGRITGLVGPDGAGKSTLLRLICGLLVPDAGSVTVLGIDVAKEPRRVSGKIGVVPQETVTMSGLGAMRSYRGSSANVRPQHGDTFSPGRGRACRVSVICMCPPRSCIERVRAQVAH